MADLTTTFSGITSPNPFWLASAPPTNSGYQVNHAFEAGWGGAVWKTLGPPVQNISNRYGSFTKGGRRMMAINNVELISDRPLEINLREIAEVKRNWPDRAVIVSAMVDADPKAWRTIVHQIEDTGADGIELNYGCPQGMSERNLGSAIGQSPEACEMNTAWATDYASIPVIQKLTPNVTDVRVAARAGVRGGANGLSLINTINSVTKVDLDTFTVSPTIGGRSTHGGYAGPAVKPIALHMLTELMDDPFLSESGLPVSGMGGISTWQDAAEFLLLGATSLQVCTAAMTHGFRIIDDLCDGLSRWMDDKGFKSLDEFRGKALAEHGTFNDLDLSHKSVARIDQDKCIGCNLCVTACHDTAHQCIDLVNPEGAVVKPGINPEINGKLTLDIRPTPKVRESDCVGCALCANVCPVQDCIEMVTVPSGRESVTWNQLTATNPAIAQDWKAMQAWRDSVGIDIH
ncbi:NAD-dependent dihydropyrimidine dehydrogenase subunit PreA [Corynebacterium alimapuense]|uniref:dihydrouracil dehydrogenase (NAD(+)) n=1 Tax=Corynebacterium alimapuense TaxID=1576874 RepID=A0A3M8K7X0_9CORY|nr:NAD-dependent dihydropyrimidine dehydrogenase subunit PreA [Corynebacterium alimapuense]RNE49313.1 NAD-dependent dihydropyrimidine dehydrogenase subunit PreA [Corynebacterium alimapuense]